MDTVDKIGITVVGSLICVLMGLCVIKGYTEIQHNQYVLECLKVTQQLNSAELKLICGTIN